MYQVQAFLGFPECFLVHLHGIQVGGHLSSRVPQYGIRIIELVPDAAQGLIVLCRLLHLF